MVIDRTKAIVVEDEGVAVGQRNTFNFVGDGVTVTDDPVNNEIDITIPAGAGLPSASPTVEGKVELATVNEIEAGADTGRVLTPFAFAASNQGERVVGIGVTDPQGDAITTGDEKAWFRIPSSLTGMNLVEVAAGLSTASNSGAVTIMVRNKTDSSDMLSTAITIDVNEVDTLTAATPAVIDATEDDVVTGDHIEIDIDGAGTGAKGLWVECIFRLP